MAKRLAVLIGNTTFDNAEAFPNLRAPANDVQDLARVLRKYGSFEILDTLVDQPCQAISRGIEDLYCVAEKGDLTLLYFSGHGYRDLHGRHYLITRDSQSNRLWSSSLPASLIHDVMSSSRSRHRVIILDCCFSGAFIKGGKSGVEPLLLQEELKGEASAILASSGTIQYSFEEGGRNSLFTQYLLEGIETSLADENEDGRISIDELFYYAERKVRNSRPGQSPVMALYVQEGEILIAKTPLATNFHSIAPIRDAEVGTNSAAARMILEPTDRARLRQFLVNHFSLNDIKDMAFDLGVDFQLFSHNTKAGLSRDLITYFEQRDSLSCLVTEILRRRDSNDLVQLLARLPTSPPHKKVQVIVSEDLLEDVSGFLEGLATKLNISKDEVVIVGAVGGSIHLLLSLPAKAADLLVQLEIHDIADEKYQIVSISMFESLDSATQKDWHLAARDWPPLAQDELLRPSGSWKDAVEAAYTDIEREVEQRRKELEGTSEIPGEDNLLRNVTLAKVKQESELIEKPLTKTTTELIQILHLSDLHINSDIDPESLLQPLIADLRDTEEGLGLNRLDFVVISGDLTAYAKPKEFQMAQRFISGLIENFRVAASRCILVPGNHDLDWDEKVYDWKARRQVDTSKLKEGSYVEQGEGLLIRNNRTYPRRFKNFSETLYHSLVQNEYPSAAEEQCIPFLFPDFKIQFLAMNSCWQIDEHFRDRASIHAGALSRGLTKADEQTRRARAEGRLPSDKSVLRIAVWHHPVTGNDKIVDDAFLERLRLADVKLCLHGHVHEERTDLIGYLHPRRKLYVAGAGSFGAPVRDRPESVPRLYNLLEIAPDHSRVRVHTRCLRKDSGAWEGWAVWRGKSRHERQTYYDIYLNVVENIEAATDP
jgi:predicted MPP superfamily phosphohydrolase